jgi:hypothetical protein
VGDGQNDVCPARLLGPSDVVFARAGFALEKELGRLEEGGAAAATAGGGGGATAGGDGATATAGGDDGAGGGAGFGRRVEGLVEGEGEGDGAGVRAAVVRWRDGSEIQEWLGEAWGWGAKA